MRILFVILAVLNLRAIWWPFMVGSGGDLDLFTELFGIFKNIKSFLPTLLCCLLEAGIRDHRTWIFWNQWQGSLFFWKCRKGSMHLLYPLYWWFHINNFCFFHAKTEWINYLLCNYLVDFNVEDMSLIRRETGNDSSRSQRVKEWLYFQNLF